MKINGTVIRQVRNSLGTFDVYKVKLKGGPVDGLETIAMNTRTVYHGKLVYRLNDEGDFVYDDGKAKDGHVGGGSL